MNDINKEDIKQDKLNSRRKFLSLIGWGSFFTAIAALFAGTIRAMFPRVLYEPPTKFKVGKPADYLKGNVTLIPEAKAFIDRDDDGIFVISAVCTHLKCRVNYDSSLDEFWCPCHGAKYRRDGTNYVGPAPKPLPRLQVILDRKG
ncbi:MAG: Rieske 2Fe-2S domain-containing protein, partial [Thermodesulfobacteriota bacterium]|nr:Rieske 2Fe-2S domain-containing protein [Thermodesulfobacteriota bacterium]